MVVLQKKYTVNCDGKNRKILAQSYKKCPTTTKVIFIVGFFFHLNYSALKDIVYIIPIKLLPHLITTKLNIQGR